MRRNLNGTKLIKINSTDSIIRPDNDNAYKVQFPLTKPLTTKDTESPFPTSAKFSITDSIDKIETFSINRPLLSSNPLRSSNFTMKGIQNDVYALMTF